MIGLLKYLTNLDILLDNDTWINRYLLAAYLLHSHQNQSQHFQKAELVSGPKNG